MDVVKTKTKSKLWTDKRFLVFIVVCSIVAGSKLYGGGSEASISRKDFSVGTVQKGDLNNDVAGFGFLRSSTQTLHSSLTSGTVKEIRIRPGLEVEPDSVVLVLNNPELQLALTAAEQLVNQAQSNLRKLKLSQKKELLEAKIQLLQAQREYNNAQTKYEMELSLVDNAIVSALQFKQTKESYLQTKEQLKIQKQLITQLEMIHLETIVIQEETIEQEKVNYHNQLNRFESLTVRAGMKGILQQLPVTLGQSVAAGQELFVVGSNDDLDAQIRVPQSQATLIQLGQLATIDTRQDKISGKVKRIDPTVRDGTVLVEVALDKPLPNSVRSELNVEGLIHIESYRDVLYMDRPEHIVAPTNSNLYKLIDDGRATATQVHVSSLVGRYVVLDRGAKEGDVFILSMSPDESVNTDIKFK